MEIEGAETSATAVTARFIMDDSQSKSDHTQERQAGEHARGNPAEADRRSLRERTRTFVSQHAREEYVNLMRLLKERVEERNATADNLPQFVVKGSTVQLDHMVLYLEFDQMFENPDSYVLVLKVGLPSRHPLFGPAPTPIKHTLRATSSDDLRMMLWANNQGQWTSAGLVEFALELLTEYHRRHEPK